MRRTRPRSNPRSHRARVPLSVASLDDPEIGALYERRLVLVRPDGHVAWRGDTPPADPLAVVDRVRGALIVSGYLAPSSPEE